MIEILEQVLLVAELVDTSVGHMIMIVRLQ